jgi:hypothetical protein
MTTKKDLSETKFPINQLLKNNFSLKNNSKRGIKKK